MEIEKLEYTLTELGGNLCEMIGWRRAIGQVYVLLYISDRALSLDDIAERVGMSKSSVWGIIQKLQGLRAVNKVWLKENRKDHFIAERDLGFIFKNGFLIELNSKLLLLDSYLAQAEKTLTDSGSEAGGEEINGRCKDFIDQTSSMKKKFSSFLSLLAPGE